MILLAKKLKKLMGDVELWDKDETRAISLLKTYLCDVLGRAGIQAAKRGAEQAINDMVLYHLKDAAERLGISYGTLKARIKEGKIKSVDGRITGAEIRRYLTQSSSNI